jgi:hypothetical protein
MEIGNQQALDAWAACTSRPDNRSDDHSTDLPGRFPAYCPQVSSCSRFVLIAVLPGAVYTWAFEHVAGAYGVTLADRTHRFLYSSPTW